MITKRESVTGKVYVWAMPTSDWERRNSPELGVFRYELSTNTVKYEDGAVRVQEYEASFVVPAGVDLLARAIATLQDKKDKVLGEAQRQATEIQSQINSLLMLAAPEPKEVEGEWEYSPTPGF